MKAPLLFLAKFLAVSLAMFVVWKPVSGAYLALVIPAVNVVCRIAGHPVRVDASGQEMVNIYGLERGESTSGRATRTWST